jgi:hypothetical protein
MVEYLCKARMPLGRFLCLVVKAMFQQHFQIVQGFIKAHLYHAQGLKVFVIRMRVLW